MKIAGYVFVTNKFPYSRIDQILACILQIAFQLLSILKRQ